MKLKGIMGIPTLYHWTVIEVQTPHSGHHKHREEEQESPVSFGWGGHPSSSGGLHRHGGGRGWFITTRRQLKSCCPFSLLWRHHDGQRKGEGKVAHYTLVDRVRGSMGFFLVFSGIECLFSKSFCLVKFLFPGIKKEKAFFFHFLNFLLYLLLFAFLGCTHLQQPIRGIQEAKRKQKNSLLCHSLNTRISSQSVFFSPPFWAFVVVL